MIFKWIYAELMVQTKDFDSSLEMLIKPLGFRLSFCLYFIGSMYYWLFYTFSGLFRWAVGDGTQITSFNVNILFWNRTELDMLYIPLNCKVRKNIFLLVIGGGLCVCGIKTVHAITVMFVFTFPNVICFQNNILRLVLRFL